MSNIWLFLAFLLGLFAIVMWVKTGQTTTTTREELPNRVILKTKYAPVREFICDRDPSVFPTERIRFICEELPLP